MRSIVPPLAPGDQGAAVANLQAALIALLRRELIPVEPERRDALLGALGDELNRQGYRDATREAVARFQESRRLEAQGRVDDPTATALNAVLREIGGLDGDSLPGAQSIVAGVVMEPDRTPFKGRVVLSQEDERGSIPLGEHTTDPEGRYAIAYTVPSGAQQVRLRLAAFDGDGQRRAEAAFPAGSAVEIVNLEVLGPGVFYRITGKVTSDARTGVAGLRVVIVDKDVGADTEVAEAITGRDGGYRAAFTYGRTKPKADLQARAFAGETLLGSSDVRYDAANAETLNVSVPAGAGIALATEHEALTGDLALHFTGRLRDLRESDERQDVAYLANKSGWDARAVALASLADEFSARTADAAGRPAIEPALFYSLFRAGIPAREAALYRTPTADIGVLWRRAIDEGVIPARHQAGLSAALDQFRDLSARQALDGPAALGRSSLGELLAVSLPDTDAAQREEFARLRIQHQGNPTRFMEAVTAAFGEVAARRLRLDGQLAYLTLNNAPLIGKLRASTPDDLLTAPVDLVAHGFHRADKWRALIDEGMVPPEVPGSNTPAGRARYAEVLATQLRLSYPTATVAAMVKSGDTPTVFAAADKVQAFLLRHHDRFDVDVQSVEQFVARAQVPIEPEVQSEITRIQRVRQITPNDAAMNALLRLGVDSAYAVAQYDRDEFVAAFKDAVGGERQATLIHAKAQQVHGAVLNVAISYLLASKAPGIGVHSPPQIVDPAPRAPENVGDVIAYASLEKLLGEMDYCECEHCRSILSPGAYLVDMLQFLDRDATRWAKFRQAWKAGHDNVPYPHTFAKQQDWIDAGSPPEIVLTPLDVLLSRRPDLQHLPLTCENTNTSLPYIDLVNETLEQFVVNGLSLRDYRGHTTDARPTPAELLANPQFIQDAAYVILAGAGAPAPPLPPTSLLPFHQPLERLRRLCNAFDAPLPRLMEALRRDDALERANDADYGWRDIRMEELRLSRPEYALLCDRTLTLQKLYGFPPATPDADVLAALSNAKAFTRRQEIDYQDLIDILRTRFINPHGALIPKLERLGLPLATLKAFKDGVLTDAEFDAALAPQLDPAPYGGDIRAWVTNQTNYDAVMGLLVLADPTGASNVSSFDRLEFRYADPSKLADRVRPFELVRLLRFIRLWKKLGWSVEQTDRAITALYPADLSPDDADDAVNLQRLDAGFLLLLPRLGVLRRVIDELQLKVKSDLLPLLACFAPMDAYGARSLYRQLFSNPSLLEQDPAFGDDGFGNVLDGSAKLLAHQEALRGALALSADEFNRIGAELGHDEDTPLTVDSVSRIFRRGWLARKLKLSVHELLLLGRHSGIDPFAAIDPAAPAILAFIELVQRLRGTALKPSQALYLIWNQDVSGTSATDTGRMSEFARTLRADLAAAERELAIADDPDGQIARARMALVYDGATTDLFFGLLNNTSFSDVPYSHGEPVLQQSILDAAPGRLSYDAFRKRLSFAGAMSAASRDALKAVPGVTAGFQSAINGLYARNQELVAPFFARYPELLPLHDAYVAANVSVEVRRSALLESFLPTLKARRKRQQALQAIASAANTDSAFAQMILGDPAVLHAAAGPTVPALQDLMAVEAQGASVRFFLRDTATGDIDEARDVEPVLDYRATGPHRLPANGGNPVSGIWSGYLEAPASGFYNVRVDADAGAGATLAIGGVDVGLTRAGNTWQNAAPIELRAGTLHAFSLTVAKVKDVLSVSWQSVGRGWEVIPSQWFVSATLRDRLDHTYTRFFKIASLAAALKLTAAEVAHLGAHAEYRIAGEGWLNRLAAVGSPDPATARALGRAFDGLLIFSRLKAILSPDDSRLLQVIADPTAAVGKPDAALFALTRWDPGSLEALRVRFGKSSAHLAQPETLLRLHQAFDRLTRMGVSAPVMISATTNEPTAVMARDLQAALRARYAESDWLAVVKPINDELRSLQRDALVAWILHQTRSNPESAHIDTAGKLFEFFLMDVQMDPCMETSRIRHALSSVQLFIERCLMNLEPRVASSALNGRQWDSMRRYRVWEANRKIFLWPENWLEPELRDDQSPLFKEMMSELLQGDITEDRAATALTSYLSKLADVAKLEPCGIHIVENDPSKLQDDVVHVVARLPGAARKYYHRKRDGASWTPWQEIKLDIEDNPVVPVVWRGRLFLFWLRLLKQPDAAAAPTLDPGQDRTLAALKPGDIRTEVPRTAVQALLCWSEYVNKQWLPARTSDVDRPTTLGTFSVMGPFAFDRSKLVLGTAEEGTGLRIDIGGATGSFLLHTTHSLPTREEEAGPPVYVKRADRFMIPFAERLTFSPGQLSLDYDPGTGSGDDNVQRDVLSYKNGGRTVRGLQVLDDPWDAPFFFEDTRHVFYVTTEEDVVQVDEWQEYGVVPEGPSMALPPLYHEKGARLPDLIGPIITDPGQRLVDASRLERFVSEDAHIKRAIGVASAVQFGGVRIGPTGRLKASGER